MTVHRTGQKSMANIARPDPFIDKIGEADLARAFPRASTRDFKSVLQENWADTAGKNTKGKSYSSFLAKRFRPKRNSPDRFYIFLLWLCLCIDRPWNKRWKFSITKKLLDEVWEILDRSGILNSPDFPTRVPDPSTFQKRLGQPDAKIKIISVSLDPELQNLGLALYHVSEAWHFSEPQKRALRIKSRYVGLVKKPINKRDLMRKLRINKTEMDQLIEWSADSVRVQDRGHGSIWVQRALPKLGETIPSALEE